jgi:hypothetical protein
MNQGQNIECSSHMLMKCQQGCNTGAGATANIMRPVPTSHPGQAATLHHYQSAAQAAAAAAGAQQDSAARQRCPPAYAGASPACWQEHMLMLGRGCSSSGGLALAATFMQF